ncbi:MAG: hypothetical protein H0V51_08710 [Chloroflexi bacterium]|nr:hypothetical protein [Chloroflexota bacterium]
MKSSLRSLACLGLGLVLGSVLAPAAAQQLAPPDGQVAVRSDRAVYVIANGVRRWVATVVITDAELNAIPEGEPIYGGLMPAGTRTPAVGTPSPLATATATPRTTTTPAATSGATSSGGSASGDLRVEFEPIQPVRQGQKVQVAVTTRENVVCELAIVYPNGKEDTEGDEESGSRGRCAWEFSVSTNGGTGPATVTVTVRDGDRTGSRDARFEITRA